MSNRENVPPAWNALVRTAEWVRELKANANPLVPESNTRDQIEALTALSRDVERALRFTIEQGRETTAITWSDIGHALAVSKQAAQHKYGPTPTRRPLTANAMPGEVF
jgi:hypothetical protein